MADPDRPLDGTRWVVDTIVTGDAASSMWAGTEGSAWLAIEDGTFTGGSGCREFTGTVTVGDGHLRFANAILAKDCEQEYGQAEEAMRAIVGGDEDVQFTVEADRLRLDHPDDVGLGLHAAE